jgi:hypothetical protein
MTKTTNPLNHPFPHAKLVNISLTSIKRLNKGCQRLSAHMIENDDPRNWVKLSNH